MPPTPKNFTVGASDIYQRLLTAQRFPDVPTGEGRATLQVRVTDVDGPLPARDAYCKVTLVNNDEDVIFEVESILRLDFTLDVEGTFQDGIVEDAISELALRVAYPYHRAAISNSIIQAGLPGIVIPLAPDSDWKQIVHASKMDEVSEAAPN